PYLPCSRCSVDFGMATACGRMGIAGLRRAPAGATASARAQRRGGHVDCVGSSRGTVIDLDVVERFAEHLSARGAGPLVLRLALQPTVAAILAVRDGLRDAAAGRPAWLWAVVRDGDQRAALVRHAWRSIAKVFGVAMVLDAVFQLAVFRWLYPF